MKTNIGGGIFHLTKYVLFFSIILLLSFTSTSAMRLEGNDFKENLPGLWEGKWYWGSESGKIRIKIIKIDGNKVHLTGFSEGDSMSADTEEVYGDLENSTLLLRWPAAGPGGVNEKYTMNRDDSNNLILDGSWKGSNSSGKSQLKKIE
jgi:hypothetical protein